MRSTTEPGTVDYSRKWYVLVAVSTSVLLATIDGSIVNVALPTMREDFGTSFSVIQWVALAYFLTMATLTAVLRNVDHSLFLPEDPDGEGPMLPAPLFDTIQIVRQD